MGRQAEPARMGNALAVEEDHIGPIPQLPKGLQQGGSLAEGEKARDVRDGGPAAVSGLFDHFQGGGIQKDHGGIDPVITLCAGDVGPCDDPDVPGEPVFQDEPFTQLGLYGHRRLVIHIPGM